MTIEMTKILVKLAIDLEDFEVPEWMNEEIDIDEFEDQIDDAFEM